MESKVDPSDICLMRIVLLQVEACTAWTDSSNLTDLTMTIASSMLESSSVKMLKKGSDVVVADE